jgi:hypothetical protein
MKNFLFDLQKCARKWKKKENVRKYFSWLRVEKSFSRFCFFSFLILLDKKLRKKLSSRLFWKRFLMCNKKWIFVHYFECLCWVYLVIFAFPKNVLNEKKRWKTQTKCWEEWLKWISKNNIKIEEKLEYRNHFIIKSNFKS